MFLTRRPILAAVGIAVSVSAYPGRESSVYRQLVPFSGLSPPLYVRFFAQIHTLLPML